MHLTIKHITLLLVMAASILVSGCAKIVTPTGGPKDTTPPKIVKVTPENQTVHFNERQIRIYFDEYVTLNNPNENVLISPPMNIKPNYTIKGKSLVITFKDTLHTNTTYNMVFANCLKDYREGNPLSLFQYSFSTGDSLDSYMIRGNILSARTLEPIADLFVMLYKNFEDSLPLTTIPDYVTKTQSDGSFLFQNINEGKYKIFALKDINSDFKYNLPNEEIAFLSETVTSYPSIPDTAADSLKAIQPLLTLYSFIKEDTTQKLLHYLNPALGIYQFPYKHGVTDFIVKPSPNAPEYFQRINATRDTITWFMKTPVTDSVLYYLNADGLYDTVWLVPFKEKQTSGRGRTKPTPKMAVSFLNAGEYHKPLTLRFPYPIQPRDSFDVYVFSKQQDTKDTTIYRYAVPDTFLTELPLPMTYLEKKTYSVMIPDSLFYGYHQITHDTLKVQFSTKSIKDYGTLIMHYELPEDGKTYIATLLEGNKVIQENVLTSSETITYSFLAPKTYQVSVFCDENKNGRWDPGDYSTKRQPEKAYNFPHGISIRAYWDSEETFTITN